MSDPIEMAKDEIRRRAGKFIAENVIVVAVGDSESKAKSAIFEGMIRQSLDRPKEKRCSGCKGERTIHSRDHTDGTFTCSLCESDGNPEDWHPFADEE